MNYITRRIENKNPDLGKKRLKIFNKLSLSLLQNDYFQNENFFFLVKY